jgi:hypothetical protein
MIFGAKRIIFWSAVLTTVALFLSGGCRTKKEYFGILVNTSIPAQAANPTPADGAADVLLTQTLSWDNAEDAKTYSVYFGTSSPGTFQGNQANTTFDPGALTADTSYYWRIDTVNKYGINQGAIWSFRTVGPPDQAANPVPADQAGQVPFGQQLSWDNVTDAIEYVVYFGTAASPPQIGCQSAVTFDPGILVADTSYYWRIDTANQYGTTLGVVWSFRTDTLPDPVSNPTPADDATQVSLTQDISWDAADGAITYAVYFGTAYPPVYQETIAGATWDTGTMTVDTSYFWRIEAINAFGNTTGPDWNFNTGTPPDQVSDVDAYPYDGMVSAPLGGKFCWRPAARATSYAVYAGQTTPLNSSHLLGITSNTEFPYGLGTLSPNANWYWRVDSINEFGNTTGVEWNIDTGDRGEFQKVLTAGWDDLDRGAQVEILDDGDVLIAGVYTSRAYFNLSLLDGMGDRSVYIARCNVGPPDFSIEWKIRILGTREITIGGLSANTDGSFYAGGSFINDIIFDYGLPTQADFATDEVDADGIYIARYNADGTLDWAKAVTDIAAGMIIELHGVAAAPDGGAYVTGYFEDVVTFMGTVLTASGASGSDIFVAKFDGAGNLEWVRQSGCPDNDDFGNDIDVLPDGSAVVVGSFFDCATFSIGALDNQTVFSNSSSVDVFIARYAVDGSLSWANSAGGDSDDFGTAIATSPGGDVYITGTFDFGAVFGPGEPGEAYIEDGGFSGYYQLFIARYDGNGAFIWADQGESGGNSDIEANSIAATDNNVYITGAFHSSGGLTLSPNG